MSRRRFYVLEDVPRDARRIEREDVYESRAAAVEEAWRWMAEAGVSRMRVITYERGASVEVRPAGRRRR